MDSRIVLSRRSLFAGAAAFPLLHTLPLFAQAMGDGEEGELKRYPHLQLDPRIDELQSDLAAPLHSQLLLNPNRRVIPDQEADLSGGYLLRIEDQHAANQLETSFADFQQCLATCLGARSSLNGYLVKAMIGQPDGCPSTASEAFAIHTSKKDCTIIASNHEGIRRALIYLEDELLARRAPMLPLGDVSRWTSLEDRITRSPLAPYRWCTGWELDQEVADYYPDAYLNRLMHCGMNGIWVAGLLNRMVASKTLPELGPKVHRLDAMKRLVEKASRYGIKVYLFCIEPRALTPDHPVFKTHPEIRGAVDRSLCVSTPLVQQYIREMMRELFTEVPKLGGIINIFNGERPTSCWSWWGGKGDKANAETCPHCKKRTQAEVLIDDLDSFMKGIREASSTAKFIVWDYGIPRTPEYKEALPRGVHPEIIWMDNFEHEGEKTVKGKKVRVQEYSLSSVGPSDYFVGVAKKAIDQGRRLYAKLQIGNTYELATIPYIPVPQMVYDKFVESQKIKIKGAMISWVIGGYPSIMLKAAGEGCFAPLLPRDQALERMAALDWGPEKAKSVVEAWQHFSDAFQQYPCAIHVFYFGPIARCPSYQLHLEYEPQLAAPYNWGLTRERERQPYEDKIGRWTGVFTPDEVIGSFRDMADEWNKGLSILSECLKDQPNEEELRKQYAVAAAIRLQFLSAANVVEFYLLRDRLKTTPAAGQAELVRRLRNIVENDTGLAQEMKPYVAANPFVGFQSEIYDYSYNQRLLDEKISHDAKTLETLSRWENTGVEKNVLTTALKTPPPSRRPARESVKDPDWLGWGD